MTNELCPRCREAIDMDGLFNDCTDKFHAKPKVVNPLKQAATQARKDLKLLLDTSKPTDKPVADAALIERVRALINAKHSLCSNCPPGPRSPCVVCDAIEADLRALCDAFEIVTRERNDALRVQIDGKGGGAEYDAGLSDTPSLRDVETAAQPDPAQDQDVWTPRWCAEECHAAAAEIERLRKGHAEALELVKDEWERAEQAEADLKLVTTGRDAAVLETCRAEKRAEQFKKALIETHLALSKANEILGILED